MNSRTLSTFLEGIHGEPVYWTRHRTRAGEILLAGHADRLVFSVFTQAAHPYRRILSQCKKGETPILNSAGAFIDAILEGDAPSDCSWEDGTYKPSALLRMGGLSLRLDLTGYTEREIAVYRALIQVGRGRTVSYADCARRAGMAGASRFVGNAMAKNRFVIIIPCHRVIRNDGSIGGFSAGLSLKKRLLDIERGQ